MADATARSFSGALRVKEIKDEYFFIANERCPRCKKPFGSQCVDARQSYLLFRDRYHDILRAQCPHCGTHTHFYFDYSDTLQDNDPGAAIASVPDVPFEDLFEWYQIKSPSGAEGPISTHLRGERIEIKCANCGKKYKALTLPGGVIEEVFCPYCLASNFSGKPANEETGPMGPGVPEFDKLVGLSMELRMKGDYKAAITQTEKWISFINNDPELVPLVCMGQSSLGELYRLDNQYDKAEHILNEALNVWKTCNFPQDANYANILANLALVGISRGDYDKAENLIYNAMPIINSSVGKDHKSNALCELGLGLIYSSQGKIEQARPLFQHASGILREEYGENDADYKKCIENLPGRTTTSQPKPETAFPPPDGRGQRFASQKFKYSFSTPDTNWQRAPHNQEIAGQADMFLGSPSWNNPSDCVLKIMVTPAYTTNFDELYGILVEAYKNDYIRFNFISKSETTVSGLRAAVLEHEGILKGEKDVSGSIAHVFIVGNSLFQVMAFFHPDKRTEQRGKIGSIIRSFQVDPNLIVDWEGTKPGGDEVGPVIDADIAMVLSSAIPWAIGGAVIFGVLAVMFLSGGAGRNFFMKGIFFILMLMAGACGGAGLKWGLIAGATGGGHQVVDWLVQAIMVPFTWMLTIMASLMGAGSAVGLIKAIMQLQTAINRIVIGFCSAAISGIPYGAYILITKKTYINAVGYILLVIIGFFPALIGLGLLAYTGTPAENFQEMRKLSQVQDPKGNTEPESLKPNQQESSSNKPMESEKPPEIQPELPVPEPIQSEPEPGFETPPPNGESQSAEPSGPEEISGDTGRQTATEPESSNEIDELTKRIEANPSDADAYNARGLAYLKINNYPKAIADCTMAIGLNPKLADAYNNRGLAYFAGNDTDKAIPDFDRAIELNPDFEDAYYSRGKAHVAVKNYDAAISDFSAAIKINPTDANYYFQRGQAYSAKGDRENATKDLNKAFELDPSLRRPRR